MSRSPVLQEWLTWAFSPATSAILFTLMISLLSPILIHFLLYRKSPSKEIATFVLAGASGAGKTSLQTLLAHGQPPTTHTSQTPQSAICTLPSDVDAFENRYRSEHDTSTRIHPQFLLLDTPGHGKLRHYASAAIVASPMPKGIIFVVDSAAIGSVQNLAETAEYLHHLLLLLQKRSASVASSKASTSVPVLVAANKQDVFTSLPPEVIKQRLEEEIGRIRQRKMAGLMDSSAGVAGDSVGDDETNWLGEYGSRDFDFVQMEEHGVSVVVEGGNVKSDDSEQPHLRAWLEWLGDRL